MTIRPPCADRRLERTGVYELRHAGRIAYAVESVPREELLRFLNDPDRPFADVAAVTIKSGRSTRLIRTRVEFNGRTFEIAYKRTRRTGWLGRWKEWIRRPRALRSWRLGLDFLRAGIDTAKPMCVIAPRRLRGGGDCYVATEWIADGQKLDDFIRESATSSNGERRGTLRALAESLGRAVGRMHAAGFSHRDLKEENIIVTGQGESVAVSLIDLDGVARYRRVPWKRRVRDLSRTFISVLVLDVVGRTDYRRFLRAYFQATGEPPSNWKAAWRQIERDGQHRLRIKERKRLTVERAAGPAEASTRRAA